MSQNRKKKNNENISVPMRRCVGCMESKPKQDLIRIAYYEGKLSVDRSGHANGRGVYICKNEKCMDLAVKKNALQRSFKTGFDKMIIEKLFEELKSGQ